LTLRKVCVLMCYSLEAQDCCESIVMLVMCSGGGDTGCNCDPTGVASLTQPCDTNSGTCQCRPSKFFSNDCVSTDI